MCYKVLSGFRLVASPSESGSSYKQGSYKSVVSYFYSFYILDYIFLFLHANAFLNWPFAHRNNVEK